MFYGCCYGSLPALILTTCPIPRVAMAVAMVPSQCITITQYPTDMSIHAVVMAVAMVPSQCITQYPTDMTFIHAVVMTVAMVPSQCITQYSTDMSIHAVVMAVAIVLPPLSILPMFFPWVLLCGLLRSRPVSNTKYPSWCHISLGVAMGVAMVLSQCITQYPPYTTPKTQWYGCICIMVHNTLIMYEGHRVVHDTLAYMNPRIDSDP